MLRLETLLEVNKRARVLRLEMGALVDGVVNSPKLVFTFDSLFAVNYHV